MIKSIVMLAATLLTASVFAREGDVDLMRAAARDDGAAITAFARRIDDPAELMTVGIGSVTPLHIAASVNATNAVAALLNAGVDIDSRTESGFTPLHWAVTRGAGKTTRLLLSRGADAAATSNHGVTPLHCAVRHNRMGLMRLLMEHDIDPEAPTAEGLTPLMMGRRHRMFNETARRLAVLIAERKLYLEQAISEEDRP